MSKSGSKTAGYWSPLQVYSVECAPPTGLVVSSGFLIEQLPTGLLTHSPWLNMPSSHLVTNSLHTYTTSIPPDLTHLHPHQQVLGSQNSFLTLIVSHTQYLLSTSSYPELAMPSSIYKDNAFLRLTQTMTRTHQTQLLLQFSLNVKPKSA